MSILNEVEIQQFIVSAQLKEDPFICLYKIAISTGMRKGEILGLQWKDIDWDRNTIHVRRQLQYLFGKGWQFSPPKTKYGIRTIKVGSQVMEVLKEQQEKVNFMVFDVIGKWHDHDLVFPAKTGKPLSQSYVNGYFKKALKDANLPEIRFHDLRHTAASLMLNYGVPVLVVSKRLGHSKPSITLDVYGHLISSMQEQAAEVMDQIIIPLEIPSPSQTTPQLPFTDDSKNGGH